MVLGSQKERVGAGGFNENCIAHSPAEAVAAGQEPSAEMWGRELRDAPPYRIKFRARVQQCLQSPLVADG